jgi:hypothetical protein
VLGRLLPHTALLTSVPALFLLLGLGLDLNNLSALVTPTVGTDMVREAQLVTLRTRYQPFRLQRQVAAPATTAALGDSSFG